MTDELRVLLKKTLRAHGVAELPGPRAEIIWGPELQGLDCTSWWQSLPEGRQQIFLKSWQKVPLREAFHIERAGITYGARMSLRARSFEEQSFFALMAAEECAHYHALSPWFDPAWENSPPGEFESLILEIIDGTDRVENLLLIQVLLEGWGLQHYKELAGASRDPALNEHFQRILKDEARHHAGGLLLFRPEKTSLSTENVRPFIDKLLGMVSIGPWSVLESAIETGARFTDHEGILFLTELKAQEKTAMKLKRLKVLLEKALGEDLDFLKLKEQDFTAPDATQMWSLFSSVFSAPNARVSHALGPAPEPSI